ncbi:MAG: 50S ribosomal protein L4 [Hyphomicrobiales bacterium]|jgi:large subunit ribosomal protein L4|nr:50S ribosomal protein L4 [Hyphomicrobiales bacterium]MCA1998463.1 50S ribosomal protein L4 [Hyphomicrobiales bacterium]
MKLSVTTLAGASAGTVEVSDEVFGLEPRIDILHRMVRYQLAKRQAGTHQAQERSTINRTTKKMFKQKGTGRARHGSAKAPQFRGGGRAFGPIARSHAHDLPKKVRLLALKHALSAKAKESQIVVLDKAEIDAPKTKALKETFGKLGLQNALIIGGAELQDNFLLASRAIPNIDVLPVQGINVYDILRREKLVLTQAALEALSQRFAG